MAEQITPQDDGKPALSDRLKRCILEIVTLVRQGVEHQRYEFKRTASITREDLDDRLDFIKLLQGIANAAGSEERFVVIGADPREKKFYPVTNSSEFDPARVSSVLTKYLNPTPTLEVFNNITTEDGHTLVVFILNSVQPRPIMVNTEGKKADGKTRLQVGDIWIKKGTALQLATRSDLDLMYRQAMEEEAEDRARKRFKHFADISGTSAFASPTTTKMPVRELLVGPTTELRRFAEELIATNDQARFLMLLEIIRESLIEGWDKHNITQPLSADAREYALELSDFFKDEFLPAIQSIVSLSILVIKYDFQPEWLNLSVEILLEAFEKSRNLQQLKSAYIAQHAKLSWWRPSFDIFIALKTIAIYTILRRRPKFLVTILQRLVVPLSIDNQNYREAPVLCWPFKVHMFIDNELQHGRATFHWSDRISNFWGEYFGNFDQFLAAACQLEFLLEFNSHLGVNTFQDNKLGEWLSINAKEINLAYTPDLYVYRLDPTVPMAEKLFDAIISQESNSSQLEVIPMLFAATFKGKTRDQRIVLFGRFLDGLKSWQSNVMMQEFRRFPFMFSWTGRLSEAVEKWRTQKPKSNN